MWDEAFVETSLKKCATKSLTSQVRFQLEDYANEKLVRCIHTRTDRKSPSVPDALNTAIVASLNRINSVITAELTKADLKKVHTKYTAKLKKDLNSKKWLKTFQGREILKRFSNDILKGYVKYEVLRDLIISSMVDGSYRPKGMEKVLTSILPT